MRSSKTNTLDQETPELEMCRAVAHRIAMSTKLARSTRLRELLLFICRRVLDDGCERLTEQEIGTEVFGREIGYDTNVDNIVRVNVSELRKRMEAYFASEGDLETVIVEIPRGSYVPVFHYRPVTREAETASEVQQETAPEVVFAANHPLMEIPHERRNFRSFRLLLLSAAVVLLVSACCALFLQNRSLQRSLSPVEYQPELKAFWTPFIHSPLDTDIVLPDASFGQIQLLSSTRVSLQEYISRTYVSKLEAETQDPLRQTMLGVFATASLVTPSSFRLAEGIRGLDLRNPRLHIYLSEEYRATSIEADNLILIGVPFANPWMQLFENRLNFVPTDLGKDFMIVNRSPEGTEQKTYPHMSTEGYCAIAFLPNSGHKGNILLIQGTDPAAFEAARFFILSDSELGNFRKLIHADRFPYFEVLLKVPTVRGTPMNANIVAYRSYPKLS